MLGGGNFVERGADGSISLSDGDDMSLREGDAGLPLQSVIIIK